MAVPTHDEILTAAIRIAPFVHRTPVLTSRTLNQRFGSEMFFKCENFQKGGSFKIRGATNAVRMLDAAAISHGVATHSSGNHAAALAIAAGAAGIPCHVVMPQDSVRSKVTAVAGYGAEITFCAPTMVARQSGLEEIVRRTGATLVHPYNDDHVIMGQATATLELLTEVPSLDVVIVPVGGGGLVAGAAIVAHHATSRVRVVAAEPVGADDTRRSFETGTLVPCTDPRTIADGLRASLGDRTFRIIRAHVETVVTVSEAAIVEAMRLVWLRMKLVIEPSAAVPLAALVEGKIDVCGKRVGLMVSGGNVDLDDLPWASASGWAPGKEGTAG